MPYVVTCFCSVELLTSAADGVMMLASDALACAEGGNIVMVHRKLNKQAIVFFICNPRGMGRLG